MERKRLKNFLKEEGYLPYKRWRNLDLTLNEPSNTTEYFDIQLYISEIVGENKKGIFLYKDEKDDVLFIGKAKVLNRQFTTHLRSSYQVTSQDSNNNPLHNFFKNHYGKKITIYWLEIENESERILLCEMMKYLYQPKYDLTVIAKKN